MAAQAEKEKFFAKLDGFDECNETESDSDVEKRNLPPIFSKQQNLQHDVEKGVEPVQSPKHIVRATSNDAKLPQKSSSPTLNCPNVGDRVATETTALRNLQSESSRRPDLESKPRKSISRSRVSTTGKGLFKGLTFYFIPNNDVAKPRKLRIQCAISQGATWTRVLGPGITHIIVDSDIAAPAVMRVFNDEIDISNIPIVKVNWLIESLSHKSVRNPEDSRFQLRGASNTFARVPSKSLAKKNLKKSPVTHVPVSRDLQPTNTGPNDVANQLDQIVQDLKEAPSLPFDEELDMDGLLSSSSGDERAEEGNNRLESIQRPLRENKGFQCMESNAGAQKPTPNDRTTSILQQMATYYDRTGDNWRTLAYRKAITALRKQTVLVSTSAQARKIKGIGSRLADKIEEIVTTDRLKRLDTAISDPDDQVLQLFMGIYGIGLKQARAWISKGYRTLNDLTVHATLSDNQKIGIEHYNDFAQRIPRAEVAQHGNIVSQALKQANRDLQAIIGGSYRRGMPDSGDVDIMITHPSATLSQLRAWTFDIVVPHLFEIGFMKCTLATSRPTLKSKAQMTPTRNPTVHTPNQHTATSTSQTSGTKFHGASALPTIPTWRRIDLLLVPPDTLGAALIYFTGNDVFNRSLRLLASKKGMRLNQYGLYRDVMRGSGRVKVTEGELIEGRSEKRIFEVLGVPYRAPEERRC